MHSPHSWNHLLYALSAMLVAATLAPVLASTVVSGCAGVAAATEANGFFTLSGSSASSVNGCFAMMYRDGAGSMIACADACAAAGLGCVDVAVNAPEREASSAECSLILDWYLASSARRAGIPASPGPAAAPQLYGMCSLTNRGDEGWARFDHKARNDCNDVAFFGSYEVVLPCQCTNVVDTTPPSLSSILGSQASPSAVTVTGTVDEPSTVHCDVGASGHAHTPANVKAAGFSDSVSSSGSFTVTVTGVSGEGTKSVACVGEDTTGNLGATVSSGLDFSFGTWSQAVGRTDIDASLILTFVMRQQTPQDLP